MPDKSFSLSLTKKIKRFSKTIRPDPDKSISIRSFILGWQLASQRHANITVAMHLVRAGEYSNFYEAKTALDAKAQEWYEAEKNA